MNAERLHALILKIVDHEEEAGFRKILANLNSSLQNQASDPANTEHPQKVSTYLAELKQSLDKIKPDSYSSVELETMQEMNIPLLIPGRLSARIDAIFRENQITPQRASDQLKKVVSEVDDDLKYLVGIAAGFTRFDIRPEVLDPGETALSVVMPRAETAHSLKKFSNENLEFDRIVKCFEEIATGSRSEIPIKTIGSSDFLITLSVAAPALLTISFVVRDLLKTYDKVLDVKIKHNELKKMNVPEEALKPLKDHMTVLIQSGIEKILVDHVDPSLAESKEGRRQELRVEAEKAVKKLADRIDRGYQLEVKAQPLPPPAEGEEEDFDAAKEELRKAIDQVEENSRQITHARRGGDAVLQLSDFSDESETKGD